MNEPFRILVVCVGNVCRSPLAERLLTARLAGASGDFSVSSAGTHGLNGQPMDPTAAAELVRLGGDPSGFVAARVTQDDVASADLVLAATQRVRGQVLQLAPAALRRTFTVRELALLLSRAEVAGEAAELVEHASRWRGTLAGTDPADLDLPDPIGRSDRVHRDVAELIDDATLVIAEHLGDLG